MGIFLTLFLYGRHYFYLYLMENLLLWRVLKLLLVAKLVNGKADTKLSSVLYL
jgi:hypothetical protein